MHSVVRMGVYALLQISLVCNHIVCVSIVTHIGMNFVQIACTIKLHSPLPTHLETPVCLVTQLWNVISKNNMLVTSLSQQSSGRHFQESFRYLALVVRAPLQEVVDAAHQVHVPGLRDHERGCAQQGLHGGLHRELFPVLIVQAVFF